MILLFVHGWSVTNMDTYAYLPEAITKRAPAGMDIDIRHIYLGRYISFHDEVKIDDIARAFEQARLDVVGKDNEFSCITHSTGGPVMRAWVEQYYGKDKLCDLPMKHLIMLAPANFGSALAQLGKSKIGRIKSWFQGMEPGEGVLNWLEIGSDKQLELNKKWMDYESVKNGFFPFVLTGQAIDKKLYDYLNSYTGEKGSDGVVRVCAANMNYRYLKLKQNDQNETSSDPYCTALELEKDSLKSSPDVALAIVDKTSHSGEKMGIMNSVRKKNYTNKKIVQYIIDCLKVENATEYRKLITSMSSVTLKTQGKADRYSMLIINLMDDRGNPIKDYDVYLLAGKEFHPNLLPKNFLVDRQQNKRSKNRLTFYLNCTKMHGIKDGCFGVRLISRPDSGFSYYNKAEFRSEKINIKKILIPNQTTMVDVVINRHVDKNVFGLDPTDNRYNDGDFKKIKVSGEDVQ